MFMTFESIRAYMSIPLARPPGRRGAWARFAPEICAAAVYGVGLAALVLRAYRRGSLFDLDGSDLMCGVVAAYWAAAMLLVVLPLGASLSAWHREHALGTAEALLLTPGWHLLLARGRYWHTAWPWVRLMLWLAPLYLVLAGHPLLREAHHWDGTDAALACVFAGGSKGILSCTSCREVRHDASRALSSLSRME